MVSKANAPTFLSYHKSKVQERNLFILKNYFPTIVWNFNSQSDLSGQEMGPDPTRAYFWPAVSKSQVLFDPTRRDFFWSEGKKLKNLTFLGKIFQTQKRTIDGWPDMIWPGLKIFDPDPSLIWPFLIFDTHWFFTGT